MFHFLKSKDLIVGKVKIIEHTFQIIRLTKRFRLILATDFFIITYWNYIANLSAYAFEWL